MPLSLLHRVVNVFFSALAAAADVRNP